MQKPSVGRTVHYHFAYEMPTVAGDTVTIPSSPQAAIVTKCRPDTDDVHLCIMPSVEHFNSGMPEDWVPFSEEPQAGHWSWPPRV